MPRISKKRNNLDGSMGRTAQAVEAGRPGKRETQVVLFQAAGPEGRRGLQPASPRVEIPLPHQRRFACPAYMRRFHRKPETGALALKRPLEKA